jgi:hypothetical protein
VGGKEVMRDRETLAGRVVTVEGDGGLSVEMGRRLVLVKVGENRLSASRPSMM